jgi:predicted transcriptional regulator
MNHKLRFPEIVTVRLPRGSKRRLHALPPELGLSPSVVTRLAILDRLTELERQRRGASVSQGEQQMEG